MFENRGKKRALLAALLLAAALPLAGCTRYTPPEMESGEAVPESGWAVQETAETDEGQAAAEGTASGKSGEDESTVRAEAAGQIGRAHV